MKKMNVVALAALCLGLSSGGAYAAKMASPARPTELSPLQISAIRIGARVEIFNFQNAPTAFVVKAPVAFLRLGALGLEREILPGDMYLFLSKGIALTLQDNSKPAILVPNPSIRLRSMQELVDWGKQSGFGEPFN